MSTEIKKAELKLRLNGYSSLAINLPSKLILLALNHANRSLKHALVLRLHTKVTGRGNIEKYRSINSTIIRNRTNARYNWFRFHHHNVCVHQRDLILT